MEYLHRPVSKPTGATRLHNVGKPEKD
jgi:hypothetical protein